MSDIWSPVDEVSSSVGKSRYWKFTIDDPTVRPFVEGSIRHISYSVLDDRVCGVVLFREAQRTPFKKWNAVCIPIQSPEFHELTKVYMNHSGELPKSQREQAAYASKFHAANVQTAREGRLCDLPEKKQAYYKQYAPWRKG